MDRSWMYSAPKYSVPFTNGVETFLDFAFEKSSVNGKILCPCTHCVNALYFGRQDVSDHLITLGFRPEYLKWVYHGEDSTTTSSGTSTMHNADHDMYGMLNDVFQTNIGGSGVETHETSDQGGENRGRTFDVLLKEAEEKLYPGCKYNKLSAVVHLYHIKCLNGCSNKSLDMMLEFLNDLLPEGNLLPKTTQQVKKIMSNLGLGYEKIHACPKGCVLFWEEKEKDESCSECGSSRWKESRDNLEIGNSPPKMKAAKILRWFPLKPRLQRLFMCSKTASLMTWHHEGRVNDGKIRHPADAEAWKDFDIKFPEFASEPRNVRLTLASDGFNPIRTMNVSNSIWPVVIIPYNLPPWLVMKQPNLILSLIIPGPSSPGNKIDVYMQPLIKELKELWDVGVETYDALNKQNFQLKAALMSTISDFPGYASLSGWSTKGALACPVCGFDTDTEWKKALRWLPSDHCWRKDTRSFDGKEELRAATKPSSGEEVLQELDGTEFLQELDGPWKKKSIFFMLPYWEHLLLRHNLDVMHIEKNVCDNIVKTLLGQGKKNKDNYQTSLDLKKMGIRKDLHVRKRPGSDTTFMPRVSYQMTGDEKGVFLRNLKLIRPPDEFSSNISRCVQLKEKKLIGMKSYDCHMLMQEYFPIALRGALPDHITSAIIELGDFFRSICYKDLTEVDLQYLESKVSITLCKLEKIFPPSFFTVMVHLVIHLVREVKLGGPVTYRWMYFIERQLSTLKSYVRNRAHPEGSIAEGYLAQESQDFALDISREWKPSLLDQLGMMMKVTKMRLKNVTCFAPVAHWDVKNILEYHFGKERDLQTLSSTRCHSLKHIVMSYLMLNREHKRIVKGQNRSHRLNEYAINKIHCKQFSEWFKKRVARMEEQSDQALTEEIKWLARGPLSNVQQYSGYIVKSYRFHTRKREEFLQTQNSGVAVMAKSENYSSSRDRRPVEGVNNYYGKLTDIIKLNYSGIIRVVLFRCEWVDINRGVKKDGGTTLVNFSYKVHTGANLADDPYIFASQVDKVFYSTDSKHMGWEVVRHVKLRDAFDMGVADDDINGDDVPNLPRIGDDGIDVTPEMIRANGNVDDEDDEGDDSD
ncbi:hypothetical protein LXL04_022438 [Taraxacum kok-saghyz]